jgi:YlmC/YmxH family sporulation protein
MECRVEDFRYKEVVNVCDGQRLGFVSDALIDIAQGRVLALVVPGRGRFFGLFGREPDYILPWDCIKRIGSDIVLIDVPGEYRRSKREKHTWFTWTFPEKREE